MAFHPSDAYAENLERVGDDTQFGPWRLGTLIDPVNERRFLHYTLKTRARADLLPSVLRFRGESASIIAPATCPRVLSTRIEGDRVEFLTEYLEPLSKARWSSVDLSYALETVIRTLATFERFHFYCGDLFPEAVGTDDEGHVFLLPAAYILPFLNVDERRSPPSGSRFDVNWTNRFRLLGRYLEPDARRIHTSLLDKLIGLILPTVDSGARDEQGDARLVSLLREVSAGFRRGDILSVAEAYRLLFGRPIKDHGEAEYRDPESPARSSHVSHSVDRVLEALQTEGATIVITGDSYTGKSDIISQSASQLTRAEAFDVVPLDEWDLFSRSLKPARQKSGSAAHTVWIIDDIDEKALACSDFAFAMLEADDYPKGSVIMSVRPAGIENEVRELLEALRSKRGDRFFEITSVEDRRNETNRLAAHIRWALDRIDSPVRTERGRSPEELVGVFLDSLSAEERRLLEFMSVARFAMPLELVLSVFLETEPNINSAVLRLASLDVLELFYRRTTPKTPVGIFLRIESTALRRLVYETIPKARRRKLHQTIAGLAERLGSFPKYLVLFHCLESGLEDLAARHAVSFLRDTKSEPRHPFLVSLSLDLRKRTLFEKLPFTDRIFADYELATELIGKGDSHEAEQILVESAGLIEQAKAEDKLRNAPLLSSVLRLLADRWEVRGEFRRARDLLEEAREELQGALPIPDQAQLLNDLGWLQYRLGDYEQSMESCRLSLNTLNPNQYPVIVAQALNLMGVVHFNTSRYDEAISYYEQAALLRERSGDENALAASFNNLALAYQSKGDFEKAMDYYNKSLDLKSRQNNRPGIAAGFLNLALLHLESRSFKEAETKCRASLAISEELGNAQLVADNYITLGDIALEAGDIDGAEHHYQESFRISHERQAINEQMGALRRLSSLALKRRRYEEAQEYAESAYRLAQRIGSKYEHAQIEVIFGDIALALRDTVESLKYYEKACGRYTALSKHRLVATVLSKIGLIHAESGNVFEARQYFDRAEDFIQADIGRELPDEFVKLQRALRTEGKGPGTSGKRSQRLLTALCNLGGLVDLIGDRREFLQGVTKIIRQATEANDCSLGLRASDGSFLMVDRDGECRATMSKGVGTLFRRTLLAGSILTSDSHDLADVIDDLNPPAGTTVVSIPIRAAGDDIGCLLLQLDEERFQSTEGDVHFYTWLGRQLAAILKLMLLSNEDFLGEEAGTKADSDGFTIVENRDFHDLIGTSEAMKSIFRTLERVKHIDSGILILGESGTGKSALARAIHAASPRKNRPFQEIHCAQIPHTLLESELFGHERGSFTGAVQRKMGLCEVADGGTLFLDDINVIPVEMQTKLLSFIESKAFTRLGGTRRMKSDVRIIAASNEDLEALCREGRFREDLYFRLKVILVELPPLRERKDDLVAIALDYVKRSCAEKGIPVKTFSPETIELFQKAPWRGNVRELQNVLERIVVLTDETVITPSSLPEDFLREATGTGRQTQQRLDDLVDAIVKLGTYSEDNPLLPALEALLARRMVDHVEGKGRAAGLLGISKPTLYARLRDFDKMH